MPNERVYTGRAKRSGTSKQASSARHLAQLPLVSTDAISLRIYWEEAGGAMLVIYHAHYPSIPF